MPTPTAQEAANYGITFSTGSAATPAGVANAAANGIVNNVQQAPSGGTVAPAMQNTGSGVATPVAAPTAVPGQPINTAQPNPATINATPFTQGLETAKASGPAPQDAGEARGAVQAAMSAPTFYKPDANSAQVVNSKGEKLTYDQYLAQGGKPDFSNTKVGTPPVPDQASPLNGIEQSLAEDKGYQQLLADRAEYNSVENQSKSLLDFYNQAVKDAGIPAINTELLNTKNIIDGTEDDIRNEVKAASGFATDSQVLALASARNKSLIKNYNNLLDTKTMAMEQVNNMVNLAGQDRAFALQNITQKLQIDQQINDYRDKFVNNAKEGYNNYIKAVGYTGLYNSLASDPHSLAIAEQTLGLPSGTIAQAAGQEEQSKQQALGQQNFENQIKLENLGLDKARLGIEQYNAQTSRINATNSGAGSMSEGDLIAYAQQYAATGNIPTGLPKGTFGAVSQVAGALPKAPGTIISTATGVVPPSNAFSNAQSDGLSATYNLITNVLPSLKTSFSNVTTNPATGLFNAVGLKTPAVVDFNSKRTSFLNALLLANSGKVVSETELKRYQGLIPSLSTLRKGNGVKLLDQLQTELTNKFNSYLSNNQLSIVGYDPKNPTGLDIGNANQFDK